MQAEREVVLRFRVVENNLQVVDHAGQKLRVVEHSARQASDAVGTLERRLQSLGDAMPASAQYARGLAGAGAIGAGMGDLGAGIEAGRLRELERQSQATTGAMVMGFTRVQAAVVAVNQGLELARQVVGSVSAGVRAAVGPAIEFESAWAGVRKTVDASEQDLAGLQTRLRALNDTLPLSTTEVLGVAEAAGQLGIRTPNIVGFTDTMVKLGATTNLSSAEAATALARLANITQLPQDQFDRLGSTIVALGNNMATTEREIVNMALRIAGAGNQVGLSETEILSYAATLSSLGIEAEAGGTAISRIFIEIAKASETGGAALDTFARVAGRSSESFAQTFRANAAQATQEFVEGLAAVETQGGSTIGILESLGLDGIRVGDALRRAAGGGDLLARSLALGATAWQENTALTAEAAQRFATVESQLTLLGKDVTDLAVRFGTELLPALGTTITETRKFIDLFDDAAGAGGVAAGGWLDGLNASLASTRKELALIKAITPDLSWLWDSNARSRGAGSLFSEGMRDAFTVDVGALSTPDAAARARRRRRVAGRDAAIAAEREQQHALAASGRDIYGMTQVPFAGATPFAEEFFGPLQRTAAWDPRLFDGHRPDKRPYNFKGYDYMREDVGPFAPGMPQYRAPTDRAGESAARRAARDQERAASDLERRSLASLAEQERVRLALLDAQVAMRDRALDFAEQDLRLAKQSGVSAQEQLRIAGQLDTLERARLTAVQERLREELAGVQQFGPVLSASMIELRTELDTVDAQLARGPAYVRDLARELSGASRNADALGDSFARALAGLQASGEGFDVGRLLRNVLQVDASDFLGDIIGKGAKGLGIEGNSLTEVIGNGLKRGFESVGQWFRGGGAATSTAPSSFVGPPTQAEAAAAGSTQAAAQAGAAAGSAAAAGYAAIVIAGIGALQGGFSALNDARKKLGASQQDVLTAGAAGAVAGSFDALGFGGVGDMFAKGVRGLAGSGFAGSALVNTTLISPLMTGGIPDPILGLLAPQIFQALGLFQPKTTGTIIKSGASDLLNKAGLPQQRVFEGGGRKGIRIPSLEQSADQATYDFFAAAGIPRTGVVDNDALARGLAPGVGRVAPLREEALALGSIFATGPTGAGNFANALLNNLNLLGVSTDEARRQMLKLAQTAGVDLIGGLEDLNKTFLQSGKSAEDLLRLRSSAAGVVELFSDLPQAIDVAKIVADRTNAKGGIDIAAVQAGLSGGVAAYGIERQIADSRLRYMDPRKQGDEIKHRIADVDRRLLDSELTFAQREQLLRERADLGFQYVDYAGQRWTGARRRREQEYGYDIAQGSADYMAELGKLDDTTADNTAETKKNTSEAKANTQATQTNSTAVQGNTRAAQSLGDDVRGLAQAVRSGLKTDGVLRIEGLSAPEDRVVAEDLIERVLRRLIQTDPTIRSAVREAVR